MTGAISGLKAIHITGDTTHDAVTYAEGMVLKGQIIDKNNNGTRVIIDGKNLHIPRDITVMEAVGDIASFEVVSREGDPMTLKYMRPEATTAAGSFLDERISPKRVEHVYQNSIEAVKKNLSPKDRNMVDSLIHRAEDAIRTMGRQMTDGDIGQMIRDGLNPEKTSLEIVAGVLKHNKPLVRAGNQAGLEQKVTDAIAHYKERYSDTGKLRTVAKALTQEALPISDTTMGRVLSGLKTVDYLRQLDSKEALQIVVGAEGSETPPTLEAVYKHSHSPLGAKEQRLTDSELEKLVTDYLQKEGITPDKATIQATKALVKHQVALSPEKIAFVANPTSVTADIEEEDLVRAMTQKMAEGHEPREAVVEALDFLGAEGAVKAEGKSPEAHQLSPEKAQQLKETLAWLPRIKDAHLIAARKMGKDNNLKDITEVSKAITEGSPLPEVQETELEKTIQLKRQVEEIRLKMTLDVAQRMEKQGIQVATAPLKEVVEGLRAEEKQLHDRQLAAYGSDLSEAQKATYHQTMTEVKAAGHLREDTYAHLLKHQTPLTLERAVTTSQALKAQDLTRAYEGAMTEVRPDLGDRIEATFDQIEGMLTDLKVPVTDSHVKAVEILARNSMPITEANILQVELIHEKIDLVTSKMNPTVVVKMIQADINPVTLSVDELLAFMKTYEKENSLDLEAGIAKLIHHLDQSGELTAVERQSMMAVYRTFDTVVRSKGAATGFMVKNGLSLTVNELFEAAKYIRSTKGISPAIEAEVDDAFGKLVAVDNEGATIRHQAGAALSGGEKLSEMKETLMAVRLEQFIRQITPAKTGQLVNSPESTRLKDMPLEGLTHLMKDWSEERPGETGLNKQALDRYLQFVKANPEVLKTFVDKGMPMTFENFERAMAMNEDNFLLLRDLEEGLEAIKDPTVREGAIGKLTEAVQGILTKGRPYETLEETLTSVRDLLDTSLAQEDANAYKHLDGAKASLKHTQMIQVTEDYYQIPVMMDGQMSQLNMYLINPEATGAGEGEAMKVLMSFATTHMGKVQALMTLEGNQADLALQTERKEDEALLKQFEGAFRQVMASTHFNLGKIGYDVIKEKEPIDYKQGPAQEKNIMDRRGRMEWRV